MPVYSFEGRKPNIHGSTYISPSADIIGDVTIGVECFIAPGARIKGDYGSIVIGDYSNIQENCVVHARPDRSTVIGDWVSVGHGAIIHGAKIKDWAVIGMGSVVSDDATVGLWSVIGEGAVVVSGSDIPNESIAVGIPAKVKGEITEEFIERWVGIKEKYRSFSKRYSEGLERIR